jgi:hypothetical protein
VDSILPFVLLETVSKEAASAWALGGEIALLITSLLVLVGLYGERSWGKWMPPVPRIKFLLEAAVLAVMLGVFGELISDAVIFLSSRQLKIVQDKEVSIGFKRADDRSEST